jgi:hypothetical protein
MSHYAVIDSDTRVIKRVCECDDTPELLPGEEAIETKPFSLESLYLKLSESGEPIAASIEEYRTAGLDEEYTQYIRDIAVSELMKSVEAAIIDSQLPESVRNVLTALQKTLR